MTKSISFSLCSGLLMLLASCSNEFQPVEEAGANSRAIGFHAVTGKQTATRATDITSDNIANFRVYGYKRDDAVFITNLEGKDVSRPSSGSGPWTYTNVAYWPDEAVVFNAYAPSVAFQFQTADATPRTVSVPAAVVTAPLDGGNDVKTLGYTVPEAMAQQVDLLVASTTQTWAPGGNTVTLNFRHALSRILFQARLVSGIEVSITDISLLNLKKTGTLNMTDAQTGFTATSWSGIADEVDKLPVLPAGSTGITLKNTGKYENVLVGDSGVMVLPQPTTLGESRYNPQSIANELAGSDFYVMVVWDLNDGSQPKTTICAVGDVFSNPALPLQNGIIFLPGKQYTFRLTLDATTNQIVVGDVGVEDITDVTPVVVEPQYDAHVATVVNGVAWAKTDVAKPGVFAASNTAGMFYILNTNIGWTPATTTPAAPLTGYDVTGNAVTNTWPAAPATAAWTVHPCPSGWRLPTKAEFDALDAAVGNRAANGTGWALLTMKDGSKVDVALSGFLTSTGVLASANTIALYATSSGTGNGMLGRYNTGGSYTAAGDNLVSGYGYTVRCVRTVPQ